MVWNPIFSKIKIGYKLHTTPYDLFEVPWGSRGWPEVHPLSYLPDEPDARDLLQRNPLSRFHNFFSLFKDGHILNYSMKLKLIWGLSLYAGRQIQRLIIQWLANFFIGIFNRKQFCGYICIFYHKLFHRFKWGEGEVAVFFLKNDKYFIFSLEHDVERIKDIPKVRESYQICHFPYSRGIYLDPFPWKCISLTFWENKKFYKWR